MRVRWAVAQKDFAFRGRQFVAGEIFQERSELVGLFIFQKKAKPAEAPLPPPAEPAPMPEPEPAAAAETWEPIAEIAPFDPISLASAVDPSEMIPAQDFAGIDVASQPDQDAIVETLTANSEPAEPKPAKRVYVRRVKPADA